MRARTTFFIRTVVVLCLAASGSVTAVADDLRAIGSGTAIVFSPDFADAHNREFYETLGFFYVESSDWRIVIEQIRDRNADQSREQVRALVVESHGTNGNGLKLQTNKKPTGPRSYISIGALREKLEDTGVEVVVLSACNSGRLLRPEIYTTLDRDVDDPLFLPATLGIIDASPGYTGDHGSVRVLRREQSNLESLLHGSTSEFSEDVRERISGDESWRFAVSTMLIQLVTRDESLTLVEEGFVREKSRADLSAEYAEELFQRFGRLLGSNASSTTAPVAQVSTAGESMSRFLQPAGLR